MKYTTTDTRIFMEVKVKGVLYSLLSMHDYITYTHFVLGIAELSTKVLLQFSFLKLKVYLYEIASMDDCGCGCVMQQS